MRALVFVLAIGLAGCIDALDPEVGAPLAARCVDADSDPARTLSFATDVAPVLQRCRYCHSPYGTVPLGYEIGHLDLGSYETIRAGGAVSGARIIVPGQPCASVLLQKLSPGPPFGSRMPLDGPPFLSDRDLGIIHDWIAEGANDN
jgi:hypothetical protein